jgi:hypothetical protein
MLLLLRHAAAALWIVEDETALLCQRVVADNRRVSASLRHTTLGLGLAVMMSRGQIDESAFLHFLFHRR